VSNHFAFAIVNVYQSSKPSKLHHQEASWNPLTHNQTARIASHILGLHIAGYSRAIMADGFATLGCCACVTSKKANIYSSLEIKTVNAWHNQNYILTSLFSNYQTIIIPVLINASIVILQVNEVS
jgi:hypothetical protein